MVAEPASPPKPRVFRNTTLLIVAQIAGTPLSILVNAIAARRLGAGDFGRYYQVLTFASFAFLFVEWGQPNVLTAKVATHRAQAGEWLGSSIAWRLAAALVVGAALPCVCVLIGYDREFIVILSLALVGGVFATLSGACQEAFRGFERMDFAAGSFVAWQLLCAAAVVPTLLLGGGLRGLVIAQAACTAAGTAFIFGMLPRMQVPRLSVRWDVIKQLVRSGQPFLGFALFLALQPMADAAMLSIFSAPDALGWYAAARKLVGVLVFPVSALTLSLYPALCRLYTQDMNAYRSTAADALYAVTVAVMPAALGCALFPALGVAIFGDRYHGPAEDDLRMLAPFIFLVYFSMPIGSCLASSGRQFAWTGVQFACVVVSIALDPPLIRWFQTHGGNGGLGVCSTTVLSEILMVGGGLYFLPSGILSKVPRAKFAAVLASGAMMALVALSLSSIDVVLRAVLSVLAYALCLTLLRGVSVPRLRSLRGLLRGR